MSNLLVSPQVPKAPKPASNKRGLFLFTIFWVCLRMPGAVALLWWLSHMVAVTYVYSQLIHDDILQAAIPKLQTSTSTSTTSTLITISSFMYGISYFLHLNQSTGNMKHVHMLNLW